MKTVIVIFCVLGVIFLYLFYSTTFTSNHLVGYIPPDVEPKITWEMNPSGLWTKRNQIKVILTGNDTVLVDIPESFGGGYLVRYKNSYPPTIGKTVYVSVTFYPEDNIYWVNDASLNIIK
jgi:hypothetical protein